MSELTFTLLRLGYLVLLWVFVLSAVAVLRRDLAGPRTVRKRRRKPEPATVGGPPSGPVPAPAPMVGGGPRSGAPTRLVVVAGPLTGTTIPLTQSGILIGRAPSCTLVLDDDYSSSRHARIYPQGNQWYVEDLGSTNGTYMNDQRIQGVVPLPPGVGVQIGQSVVELQG
ncbi:FHA domain-containing protein FhaB/FipA [Myceligenerans xiligouense]|uniref:FHA domain-containing protein n=1 Tax=Myceligenerans xiligouense TaxID=253184 RepID=A0A3N4YV78_9MICO|nr:FHA domain-containing protein [Myceligenerans xiligouense]RPF23386.1 FHA domain-containing protein [Myceligenerans xiligouense]